MKKIAIVTDSTCDIPGKLLEKYNIYVLPLRIVYKDGEYRDNIDISASQVYESLKDEVPTTSLPKPNEVLDLFEKLKQEGVSHVIAIHLSSGLSGTKQMIEKVASEIEEMTIKVIDSKSISLGLGYTVLEAAKRVHANLDFDSVCTYIQKSIDQIKVYFVLDTLEYLIKGGRIGKVSGTLGQILQLKPIITINEEGIYTTFAKVRGRKQSINKLLEIAKGHVKNGLCNIGICHGEAPKEAVYLNEEIGKLDNLAEIINSQVSPVIGVHTGPGTIGIVVSEVIDK